MNQVVLSPVLRSEPERIDRGYGTLKLGKPGSEDVPISGTDPQIASLASARDEKRLLDAETP